MERLGADALAILSFARAFSDAGAGAGFFPRHLLGLPEVVRLTGVGADRLPAALARLAEQGRVLPAAGAPQEAEGPDKSAHVLTIIDLAKAFDTVEHKQLWRVLRDVGVE